MALPLGALPIERPLLTNQFRAIEDADLPGVPFGYRETLPSADPFPTSVIWWTDGTKVTKLYEKLITWTGTNPTTIVYKLYTPAGALYRTYTDVIVYSGPFETHRTRTVA